MNFLAHILLSGDSEGLIIGNFIADAVRGNEYGHFSPEIIKGIQLHRRIDQFTDCHPVFLATKARLRPEYGKYAGVIGDIFYDHFLAVDWDHYHAMPLDVFVQKIYTLIQGNIDSMPEKVQEFLPYMIRGNWLLNYSNMEGIRRTLEGMSRRAKFPSKMHHATDELQRHYEAYHEEFRQFFPEVQNYTRSVILNP